MTTRAVFLDTNWFLHFIFPDQVQWQAHLQGADVVLHITPVVLRELGKHKDTHSEAKIRDRAASAIARLNAFLDKGLECRINQSVTLRFVPNEPTIDLGVHHLTAGCADDLLIAAAVEARSTPDVKPLVATADIGIRMKCIALGLEVFIPPNDLKLPETPDPQARRVKELEEELAERKRLSPRLGLQFANGKDRINLSLQPRPRKLPSNVQSLQAICQSLPCLPMPNIPEDLIGSPLRLFSKVPLPNDVRIYNMALDRYFEDYKKYLEEYQQHLDSLDRYVPIELVLTNTGTSPADDIDVNLHFPDGFSLYDANDLPGPPEPPEPPTKPVSPADSIMRAMIPGTISLPIGNLNLPRLPRPGDVSIRKTNSYDVTCEFPSLKHSRQILLAKMIVSFATWENVRPFNLEYAIQSANVPKEITGTLHVIVSAATNHRS